jgi:hypothetical protein
MAKKLEERVARLEKELKLGPFPGTEPRKEEKPEQPAAREYGKSRKKKR